MAQKYAATYLLTSSTGRATSSYTETWIVPATSSTLTIPQLWGGSSAPQFTINIGQLNAQGMADGTYCLSVAGGGVIALVPCTGGGALLFDSQVGLFDSIPGLFDSH